MCVGQNLENIMPAGSFYFVGGERGGGGALGIYQIASRQHQV